MKLLGEPQDYRYTDLSGTKNVRKALKNTFQASDNEGYISHLHNLVKGSGIYAVASFVLPLVTLVLAPFLTHALSRTDYGVLTVLSTAISLVAGITQFGLNNAFFRAYSYDYGSQQDRQGVLSTVVILLSLSSLPITLMVMIIAPWLATLLFDS